jgi:hypothetical protein
MRIRSELLVSSGLFVLGCVGFWGLGAGAQEPSAAQAVLLRDVRVIDGTGAGPREHVSLLLRGGRIEKIGKAGMAAPAGVEVKELAGKTVMTGADQCAFAPWVDGE